MTGKYTILMGEEIHNVKIDGNKLFYHNQHISGAILLTILAPKKLMFPYLMYRKKNGSNVLALCCTCAEEEKLFHECQHNDRARCFTASYLISEVEFALSLGYQILFIHEIHCFTNSDYILKDFVQLMNDHKLLASDCFKQCKTDVERLELCSLINENLSRSNVPKIYLSTFKPNIRKRNFFKLICNALFGKLSSRSDKPTLKYVNSQDELADIFHSSSRIEDVYCINDNTCLVKTCANTLKLPPNRSSNVYIGSQIIAYSREIMYKHLMTLQTIPNCKIYQIECDSIFFSVPVATDGPLQVGPFLGQFKNVYDDKEIVGFYSLGQKQYCINLTDNSKVTSVFKISGLSLQNEHNENVLDTDTFENFLNSFCEGETTSKIFRQKRFKSDFTNLKIVCHNQPYTLTNQLSRKRLVNTFDEYFTTFPFGYDFD